MRADSGPGGGDGGGDAGGEARRNPRQGKVATAGELSVMAIYPSCELALAKVTWSCTLHIKSSNTSTSTVDNWSHKLIYITIIQVTADTVSCFESGILLQTSMQTNT